MYRKDNNNALVLTAVLRDKGLEMAFNVDVWEDPGAWGLFLADLAHHVGDAYEKAYGLPVDKTIDRVVELFETEMAHPTDQTQGHLHRNANSVNRN